MIRDAILTCAQNRTQVSLIYRTKSTTKKCCRPLRSYLLGYFVVTSDYDFSFMSCMEVQPSVLWRCWLGGRKGIRPVKNWVVGCWHGYLSGARCRLAFVQKWNIAWWHFNLTICLTHQIIQTDFFYFWLQTHDDAIANHCLLLQWNPDRFYLSGTYSPG